MELLYILATALAVSIDSLICGFSLSFGSKKRSTGAAVLFGITSTVAALCFTATFLGEKLKSFASYKLNALGGVILILVGLYNLLGYIKDKNNCVAKNSFNGLKQALIVGFAIGLDGALACFSLVLSGYSGAIIPIFFTFTHLLLISVGIILSKLGRVKLKDSFTLFAPFLLIILGISKFFF